MRKRHFIVAAGLATILTLGCCSCSASHESTTTVSTEFTSEDGTTDSTTTTTTEKDGEVETTTEDETIIDVADWEDAWMGETTRGYQVFFAQSPDGGAQGMLVIYDPETETLEAFVGENTTDEEGTYVTTTDAANGSSFTMGIIEQDEEGNLVLDMSDDYGQATLEPCGMDTLLEAVQEIDVNGTVIA